MTKKGQVTMYILIGVVLVLIVASIYLFRNPVTNQSTELSEETQRVKMFVESCIDKSAIEGARVLASQGGCFLEDVPRFRTDFADIPYYYYEGKYDVITEKSMSDNYEYYLEGAIKVCTDNFTAFDYEITQDEVMVRAEIQEDKLDIYVTYPITVKTSKEQQSISTFQKSYDIRLGRIRNVAESIMNETKEEPSLVPLSFMLAQQEQNNLSIGVYEQSNDTAVYFIRDNSSTVLSDAPLMYAFAIKLNESEIMSDENLAGEP